MGTTHSKSGVAIASFVALACTSTNGVVDATRPFATSTTSSTTAFLPNTRRTLSPKNRFLLEFRGGEDTTITGESEVVPTEEKSLDDKVYAAMEKLGLSAPSVDGDTPPEMDCKDGVCAMPDQTSTSTDQPAESEDEAETPTELDPTEISERIAKDLDVDPYMAMAAVGATATIGTGNKRFFDESAARTMIQQELDLIAAIPEDSEAVTTLTGEGFDAFMSRRALAFSENNVEDARAILLAEQMDAEEEEQEAAAIAAAQAEAEAYDPDAAAPPEDEFSFEPMAATTTPMETSFAPMAATTPVETTEIETESEFVEVKSNFDPTKLPTTAPAPAPTPDANSEMPKPARKEDVVFEATTEQIQELVLESKVPVLLDVYADWCGPCKALTPALEDMAIKSGGMFRVVKINSDNERPLSQGLGVASLPTVFGINNGKIVHMFEGMPKNEEMIRNFMMGLFGAAPFKPPVSAEQNEKYAVLTNKLIKSASAASFSFSARERLTDRIVTKMDAIVNDDSVADVEASATLLRTFLNNIVNNPYEGKFRKINLANKVVASKIGKNASCLAVLRSVGFTKSGSEMFYRAGQKVINIAPLSVARDTIDKWIQRNRKEMASAARKRKDELDRAQLVFEEEEEESEEEEVEEIDPTQCTLKLRLDGKNKIHDAVLHKDDPLTKVLEELNVNMEEDEIQITCVAKRLVVKSSDKEAMEKTLGDHGLIPSASIVVKVGSSSKASTSSMKERAAEKKKKTGTHTMQSIGVYAKDDNNKANLVDGGGGVMYEQDITDDEDEGEVMVDEKEADDTTTKETSEEESVETEENGTADE